jgi:hypothetical protein
MDAFLHRRGIALTESDDPARHQAQHVTLGGGARACACTRALARKSLYPENRYTMTTTLVRNP